MADKYKASYVMIFEHMLELCGGDAEKCVLLDKLMYFSGQKADFVRSLEEEIALGNLTLVTDLDSLRWVKMSAGELCKAILIGTTARNVSRKLRELIDAGLVLEKPDQRQGQVSQVRPHLGEIKRRLADLGYTLDGGIIKELVDGVENQYANPHKVNGRKTQTEFFESIPGAVPSTQTTPKAKAAVAQTLLSAQDWIRKQRKLDHAPEPTKYTAYLLYKHTGFVPDSDAFMSGLIALDKAAGSNEEMLVKGLLAGEQARRSDTNINGITMVGPRSYLNFVREKVAAANKPVDATAKGGSVAESDSPQRIGQMVGQKTVVKDGKTTIEIGSNKKRVAA